MYKFLFSTFLAFILGFFSSRHFTTPAVVIEHECEDLNAAKENLVAISKKDYLEYAKIKDLKQKYEKADELLGKIFLLFLADVGFKAQHNDIFVEPKMLSAEVAASKANEPIPVAVIPEKPSHTNRNLARRSSQIRNIRNERQIRDVLDHSIIESPKVELANGNIPLRRQMKNLEGRYVGVIRFFDQKRENLDVMWELLPDYSKSGLSGTFNLNIHGPGTSSDSKGSGNIDNIISLAEDPDGFLVSGCGGSCFLQLYYNSVANQFYGNYYESTKGSPAKPERKGLVELKR